MVSRFPHAEFEKTGQDEAKGNEKLTRPQPDRAERRSLPSVNDGRTVDGGSLKTNSHSNSSTQADNLPAFVHQRAINPPSISDPGQLLARAFFDANIQVPYQRHPPILRCHTALERK